MKAGKYGYILLGTATALLLVLGLFVTTRSSEAEFSDLNSPPAVLEAKATPLDQDRLVVDAIPLADSTQSLPEASNPHDSNAVEETKTPNSPLPDKMSLMSQAEELINQWQSNLQPGWYHKVETNYVAQLSQAGAEFHYLDADDNKQTMPIDQLNHGEITQADSWYYINELGHLVEGFTLFMDENDYVFARTVYANGAWYNESLNLLHELSPAKAWQDVMPEYGLQQSLPALKTDEAVLMDEGFTKEEANDSRFHLMYAVAYDPYEYGPFTFSATRFHYAIDENSGQIMSVSQGLLNENGRWIRNYHTEIIMFDFSETLPATPQETLDYLKEIKLNHAP